MKKIAHKIIIRGIRFLHNRMPNDTYKYYMLKFLRLRFFLKKKLYVTKKVHTMLLSIGFPRSGSSIIGFLLTAHPDIIMPDEPIIDGTNHDNPIGKGNKYKMPNTRYLYNAEIDEIFDHLLYMDELRYLLVRTFGSSDKNRILKRDWRRQHRYLLIPNQWQGRFKRLKVIGVKQSHRNPQVLAKDNILKNLENKLEDKKISLKFILTVRNPYDMISTHSRADFYYNRENKLTDCIEMIAKLCEYNAKILNQTDPDNVFIHKHEAMIANPKLQLTRLCDFLQVPATTDYLDACASRVIYKPIKSRFEIDWTQAQKSKVASLIEQYDFFSGYDWES